MVSFFLFIADGYYQADWFFTMRNYMIEINGEYEFVTKYTPKEMESYVMDFIQARLNAKEHFSEEEIYYYIYTKADKNGDFINKDPNTFYELPRLSKRDKTLICAILSTLILNAKIFIDYSYQNKFYCFNNVE